MKIEIFFGFYVDTDKRNCEVTFNFTHWNFNVVRGEGIQIYALGPLSIVLYNNKIIMEKTKKILDKQE